MKTKVLLILFVLLYSLESLSINDTTKVLFIGNSLTYRNNLPQIFEDISWSLGDTTEVTMHASGGAYLVDHVVNEQLFDYFREGYWNYVVIQPGAYEFGGETVGGAPVDSSLMRIKLLLDSIYFYNPCSEVFLYEISDGVAGNSPADMEQYNSTMDLIRTNTEYFSDSAQIAFAPVGECFRTSWNNDTNRFLWVSTYDIHPNYDGSYLAACTFYSTIFNRSSLGSEIDYPIPGFDAEYYQLLADSTVLNHISDWNIDIYSQFSDFSYSTDLETVFFEYSSLNCDSVLWDFGDETFSKEFNPVHVYDSYGTYFVTLNTFYNGCQNSFSEFIELIFVSIKDIVGDSKISVYPNPSTGVFNINMENNYNLEVFDITGRLINTQKLSGNSTLEIKTSGVYFFRFSNEEGSVTQRVIVQ